MKYAVTRSVKRAATRPSLECFKSLGTAFQQAWPTKILEMNENGTDARYSLKESVSPSSFCRNESVKVGHYPP